MVNSPDPDRDDADALAVSRREVTRSVLWSALGTALGVAGCAATPPPPTVMPVPGPRHAGGPSVNLRSVGAVGDGVADDAPAFNRAVDAARISAHVVFIPPGDYRIGAHVDVPAEITLSFAPGAVLHPDAGVSIAIAGGLDVGLQPIFNAVPGAVLLTGQAVPVVYPEWWGARGAAMDALGGTDSTQALACAFRAAHTDRWREHSSRPCIPIALSSSYRVTSPLVIEGNPNGFRIVGAQPIGSANIGATTLFGDFGASHGHGAPTLLTVRGVFGWSIENVSFRAGPGVGTCLRIEATELMSVQGASLSRCTFVAHTEATALEHLVYVGRLVDTPSKVSNDDVSTLTFDRCYFNAMGPSGDGTATNLADGVVLRAGNALGMLFTACFFGGRMRRFIACGAGTFALMACVFHNIEPTGCDVTLDVPGVAAPGAFTAVQCESQSWKFLESFTSEPRTLAIWPTVLIGLRHANVNGRGPVQPSIHWDSAGSGGALVLVGCRLGGDVLIGPNATSVLDLGTNFLPHGDADEHGTRRRGGAFTGAVSALRGVAGLMAHPTVGTDGIWSSNALRVGGRLYRLGSDNHDIWPDPWSAGDVWLRPEEGNGATTTLATSLHAVRVARGEHHAWEGVFGSEDYSGPYTMHHDPARRNLMMDTVIVPVARGIYEVLWHVRTDGADGAAVGRDTVVVTGDGSGCHLASQANALDNVHGVRLAVRWIDATSAAERDGVPGTHLAGMRLRIVLTGVAHDPGQGVSVKVRRLA